MRSVVVWLFGLVVTAILVAVSYQWLDRPIALLMHGQFPRTHRGLWVQLTHIPNPLIPLALIAFVIVGLRALIGRTLSDLQITGFVCSLSVILAETAKNYLKFVFGRTWPESWTGSNPSFVRDGIYGFHFMHGGDAYNSFPSGHTATACAVLSVVWIWYPRLRWPCVLAGLAVGAGLVAANYHFLSDVIAGAFLGISVGWMSAAVWKVAAPKALRRAENVSAIKD